MTPTPPNIVIDAGVGLHLTLNLPLSEPANALWGQWAEQRIPLYAPSLWRYEVTSVLRKTQSLGQLTEAEAQEALDVCLRLQPTLIEPDIQLCLQAFQWAKRLNQRAAYDGFYVALAKQLQADFWTTDKRLANNLRSLGITWAHCVGEIN